MDHVDDDEHSCSNNKHKCFLLIKLKLVFIKLGLVLPACFDQDDGGGDDDE